MVRSIHKTNILFGIAVTVLTTILIGSSSALAAQSQNVTFNVNLTEVLTVSLTEPTAWASGQVGNLLRNKVTVSALTNNYYGATVSMYADGTRLENITSGYNSSDASTYINTLNNNSYTYNSFPNDAWGYSLQDADTPVSSASYLPVTLVANPVTVISNSQATIGTNYSKDVFFGAKATSAKQSGTYAQTVNFVAISGIDTDPAPTPSTDNTDSEIASHTPRYNATTNRTTYTTRTATNNNTTTTTTTHVNPGNTVSSYTNPAGVTASSNGASNIVTALAVAAGVTAVSGVTFFILAKRDRDDDEEEEEE